MEIIDKIKKELIEFECEEKIKGQTHFFKEDIKTHGWSIPDIRKLASKYFNKQLSKDEIFRLCENLWKTGYIDEGLIASIWSYKLLNQYEEKDFIIFERWVKNYISNWANCDIFCTDVVGDFLIKFTHLSSKVKRWAEDDNRWVKRASAVSFIRPAKKGLFKNDIFEIANTLMEDKDDMVQKGYGWMLKCLSMSKFQQEVYDFVTSNVSKMPRTAYRYSIEKLPIDMKNKAMSIKY
jgi:3-methyladenine DNA glycosylase AlkD